MSRSYDIGKNAYGNHYNWYAATAESGTFYQAPGSASDSLCPAGWQLPVGGNSSTDRSWAKLLYNAETYKLSNDSDSSNTMRQMPLSLVFGGSYDYVFGALNNAGTRGSFWSANAEAWSISWGLEFGTSDVAPRNASNKPNGFAVRCLLRNN